MRYDEFTPQEWDRIWHDWRAWWAGTLARPLVLLWTRDPDHPPGGIGDNLVRWPVATPPQTIQQIAQETPQLDRVSCVTVRELQD
jgi:hypothetical protein